MTWTRTLLLRVDRARRQRLHNIVQQIPLRVLRSRAAASLGNLRCGTGLLRGRVGRQQF